MQPLTLPLKCELELRKPQGIMMISFSAFEGAIEECFWVFTTINERWDEDHKAVVRQPV